jgi:hypothetical protein
VRISVPAKIGGTLGVCAMVKFIRRAYQASNVEEKYRSHSFLDDCRRMPRQRVIAASGI